MTKYYAVIGNFFDQEDFIDTIEAESSYEAVHTYIEMMWKAQGLTPEEREEAESRDQGVFISFIVSSLSPITIEYAESRY